MVAVSLSSFAKEKDANNDVIGSWAEQVGQGKFRCKWCLTKSLSFDSGRKELVKHSTTAKHKENRNVVNSQQTVKDLFKQDKVDDNSLKAADLEIALSMLLARHDIPFTFADCLLTILKKYVTDSEILSKVQLGSKKVSYLVNFGLGEFYEKETVEKMKSAPAFAISLDESEVNKASQMECVVNIATEEGVECRHYRTIDIERPDAETIVNTLTDSLLDNGIDYKSKMIDCGTDGCVTMLGKVSGVIKRLQDEIKDLHFTGSCSGHNLANVMKHACDSFDEDLKESLVDLYQDVGGAKGKGLKKMKEFKKLCESRGHNFKPFKRFVSTRFRTLQYCIEPALHNFEEIVLYYKSLKKPSPRQKRLKEYFVEREYLTKLKLKFIFAATTSLTEKIDFFEKRKVNVHNAPDIIENIVVEQMRRIFCETELKTLNPETEEVKMKNRSEIAAIDVKNAKKLSNKSIFIGNAATEEIKECGLSPSSPQLEWFYEKVIKFHTTAVKFLLKYYAEALRSPVMDCFSALSPSNQSHVLTANKLRTLANKYSKVAANIKVNGMDLLKSEIEEYHTDETVKDINEEKSYEDFWIEVGKMKVPGTDWTKYEVLPLFALSLGVKFNSNSEVERTFSVMNNIHQIKQRNGLSQDSLNSCLHIKSGVESKTNKKFCSKCDKIKPASHCHCAHVHFSDQLRAECRSSRSRYETFLDVGSETKEASNEEMIKKRKVAEEELKQKTKTRKEYLSTRNKFCSSKLLEPVYKKNNRKEPSDVNKNKVVDTGSKIVKRKIASTEKEIGGGKKTKKK